MARINPFQPNSPVAPGMFAGRIAQLDALEVALLQTRAGRPKSFMLTGERGIGKTSLLHYLKDVAEGYIETTDSQKLRFLVVELDVDDATTPLGLIRRVELALERELSKTEPARNFIAAGWEFLKRIEAAGISLRDEDPVVDPEVLQDEFAHSLAQTAMRVSEADAHAMFGAQYDGVLLLIDEADNAPKSLRLGAFLKLLDERVRRHGCDRLIIGLAGMPRLRDVLRESHPSSLRIFDEYPLDTLSAKEINRVIDRALKVANEENSDQTIVDDSGRHALFNLSEGYPHFIQQFGYSAFAADTDGTIDAADVVKGAFGPQGAMEKIGDRYYRDAFYNKIQKDSYRQVLRIMAEYENRWVLKSEIRGKFKGKTSVLDNAIHALKERKIILAKEGVKGTYRLQHRGFALWIRIYATDAHDLRNQIEREEGGIGDQLASESLDS